MFYRRWVQRTISLICQLDAEIKITRAEERHVRNRATTERTWSNKKLRLLWSSLQLSHRGVNRLLMHPARPRNGPLGRKTKLQSRLKCATSYSITSFGDNANGEMNYSWKWFDTEIERGRKDIRFSLEMNGVGLMNWVVFGT